MSPISDTPKISRVGRHAVCLCKNGAWRMDGGGGGQPLPPVRAFQEPEGICVRGCANAQTNSNSGQIVGTDNHRCNYKQNSSIATLTTRPLAHQHHTCNDPCTNGPWRTRCYRSYSTGDSPEDNQARNFRAVVASCTAAHRSRDNSNWSCETSWCRPSTA